MNRRVHKYLPYIILAFFLVPVAHAALLSGESIGFDGRTRNANYDQLVDALCSNSAVVTTIGDKLWVPWYSSSSSCTVPDLQRGGNCNGGETIDAAHNCMVTDEFSQVGILIAMAKNQTRMDQFFNTAIAIKSSNGALPAWRVYRSGSAIDACKAGINDNCDTASDATARIIMAFFTAANNQYFTDQSQKNEYSALARTLSEDFLRYEVVHSCYASDQGYGDICWWLAAGSEAKNGGMASSDFAYTGYYGDAIDAMLMACAATGNATYCAVAGNFTLNYLQAAKFDGATFTVPPGRSFKWAVVPGGVPVATCTNTCSPVQWDSADAPRALGLCQSNHYAQQLGIALPRLQTYCTLWGKRYYAGASSVPLQFSPDGAASAASQQGYFANGLEALYQSGGHDVSLFAPALDGALAHYSSSSRTWDNSACFGVYTTSFAIRALGFGIGRDAASFAQVSFPEDGEVPVPSSCRPSVNNLPVTCTGGTITKDEKIGCRTVICSNGQDRMQVLACDKPDSTSPAYFEVYKQERRGTSVTEICLGQTCISDNGFARDEYPACTSTPINTQTLVNDASPAPNTSVPDDELAQVSVGIAPWFPQGANYVFVCDTTGFEPTRYDWSFGDGQRQFDATRSDVYHTYASPGSYNVMCTAKNAAVSASATLAVTTQ